MKNTFFQNFKVGTRLAAGFGLVLLLLVGVTALGISRLGAVNGSTELIVKDRYPKVALANGMLDGINETAIMLRNILIMKDPAMIEEEKKQIVKRREEVESRLAELDRLLSTPKGKEIFKSIQDAHAKFHAGQTEYLKLIDEGHKEAAAEVLIKKVGPDQQKYFDQVRALVALGGKLMDKSGAEADEQYRSGVAIMLGLAGAAILAACGFAWWVTRSITRPLNDAVRVARMVASGDLTSRIEVKTNDETGQLLQALKDMNDSLVKIVGEVRSGTETIANASNQIATGNLDLSSRTEQQASSLEETASSMEELTSTVKQNADNARQANGLATTASDVASKGGAVVSQVVETMGSINESSKKIVDIISVINGIAFQTNILALNAAVEAARAGEQGRGFAVVASEVRSLAQRSAAAAKEIKTLIDNSVEKVDTGSKLVGQAGATMSEIVDSIKHVTDIMGEITASTQEQSRGIEQVNQAITEMDNVTQQNAVLVEQAAAASESMQEQAGQLVQVVSTFKLAGQQAVSAPVARVPRAQLAKAGAPKLTARPQSGKAIAAPAAKRAELVRTSTDDWEEF
jgi:methyl-accepting chemotaxis protein